MSKLEFYLAPFGLSRIANPSVLLRLELFNGGLSAVRHFLKVYMGGKKRHEGKLGHAAHTCILFGKSRSPKVGNEKGMSFISVSKIVAATGWVNSAIRINQDGKGSLCLLGSYPRQATFCVIVESFFFFLFSPSLPFGSDREKSISWLE